MLIRALVFDISPLLAISPASLPDDLIENALLCAADDLTPRLIEADAALAVAASDNARGIVFVLNADEPAVATGALECDGDVK